MTAKERLDANEMTGTVFAANSRQPDAPEELGVITISGTLVYFAIYPEQISSRGNSYRPVRCYYPRKENGRLIRVNKEELHAD